MGASALPHTPLMLMSLAVAFVVAGAAHADETVLHNGIRLPDPWPPSQGELSLDAPDLPPWLQSPPEIIPIDLGRQLFVDDFLIEETSMERVFHLAEYYEDNPVIEADRPWEHEKDGPRQGPMAMPFSDGAWYDPTDGLFKLWYYADYGTARLCVATSPDGIHWEKPSYDVSPGTNIAIEHGGGSRVVWLDRHATDPARRFVLITSKGGQHLIPEGADWWGSACASKVAFSPDGVHWSEFMAERGPSGDRNSAWFDPFRGVWVFSIRAYEPFGGIDYPMRFRRYWETTDLAGAPSWEYREPMPWIGADRLDLTRQDKGNIQPELYNLDAVAYENLMLGLFSIWRGGRGDREGRPKPNEVCVGFSRDGFHWYRPDRRAFLPISEEPGAWNWGNVQSAGGGCLVVGDRLYFYCSGRKGAPGFEGAGGSTGLAFLRRDGFASMRAGDGWETLTTRPVTFSGAYLFVNADADGGELRAEVFDRDGNVIEGLSRVRCEPVREDSTIRRVRWRGTDDLSALAGTPVRFRFHARDADLYAFWVSADKSGASNGYVAAGGPGFPADRDTIGLAAYR